MNVLRYKAKPTDQDKLDVAYYLFLQDRVAEALQWFDKVDTKKLPSRLQIDYLRCYAAFYRERSEGVQQVGGRQSIGGVDV